MNIWYCPSGKGFLRDIRHAAEDSCHSVAIIPPTVDIEAFVNELGRYLTKKWGDVHVFSVDNEQSLLDGLRQIMNMNDMYATNGSDGMNGMDDMDDMDDDIPAWSMDELVQMSSNAGACLLAQVDGALSAEGTEALHRELKSLVQATKRWKEQGNSTYWQLVLALPATVDLPCQSDVFVRDFACWGWLRPADLEYAIDLCIDDLCIRQSLSQDSATWFWICALCRSLAGMDPTLASPLLQTTPRTMEDIQALLERQPAAALAERLKSDVHQMEEQRHCFTGLWPAQPPTRLAEKLWRAGLYNLNCHGRPCLHPVALAVCKRSRTLEQMVVRGQIQVYLPMVQEVHHFLLDVLGNLLPDWQQNIGSGYEGYHWDIGPLVACLQTSVPCCPPELVTLARLWRDVRNLLAHNKFLPFDRAIDACRAYEEAQDQFLD